MKKHNDEVFMRIGEAFGERIANIIQSVRPFSVIVDSVDEENAYVRIYEEDEPMPIPLLTIGAVDGSFKLTPAVESLAVVSLANGDDNLPFFVSYTVVDKIEFNRGNVIITLDATEEQEVARLTIGESVVEVLTNAVNINTPTTTFNGGNNDGMVKINELTDKLNNLQSELQSFVSTYNSHSHAYTWTTSAGAGNVVPTTSTATPPTRFNKSDYENTEILQ